MNSRGLKVMGSRSLKIRSSWRPKFGLFFFFNGMLAMFRRRLCFCGIISSAYLGVVTCNSFQL